MSVGPKIFLLENPNDDLEQFKVELQCSGGSSHFSTYTFKNLSDIDCFKVSSLDYKAFFFIIPFKNAEIIGQVKQSFCSSKCIIIDDKPSLDKAVSATKNGADKYLSRCPLTLSRYIKSSIRCSSDNDDVQFELNTDDFFCSMIGRSALMREVFAKIEQVSRSNSTVLITGESGCGKELVAKAIHRKSRRAKARQVSINCGAIPRDLLESELFGHVKGSFTGAISDKKGKFELADQGTIFLDEIGDMNQSLQVKLLRTLQARQIESVGSEESKDIDVRIIAATHQDLKQLVLDKKFREDLYYRLNVIPIHLPRLSQRTEDIPLLITHFINEISQRNQSEPIKFSSSSMSLLLKYTWPGNVRELENLVERLMVLKEGRLIEAIDLPNYIYSSQVKEVQESIDIPDSGIDLKSHLTQLEFAYIEEALKRTNGNKKKAAQLLNIKRTTLVEKIKKMPLSTFHHVYS